MKYWVNTVSLNHVQRGVEGGFTQADHGRAVRLKRLAQGDWIVFYSPRTDFRAGEPLQQFTAMGQVLDEEPYQVELEPDFHPWRRRVEFLPCQAAPIQPLIQSLDFIPDKRGWGFTFKRGLFEIGAEDFRRIAQALQTSG